MVSEWTPEKAALLRAAVASHPIIGQAVEYAMYVGLPRPKSQTFTGEKTPTNDKRTERETFNSLVGYIAGLQYFSSLSDPEGTFPELPPMFKYAADEALEKLKDHG